MPKLKGAHERGFVPRSSQDIDSILTQELRNIRKQREGKKLVIRTVCILAALIILTVVMFRIAVIHGEAMSPTLHDGDIGLTWRLGSKYKQGDIVLFEIPLSKSLQVGRIIAVPGDKVSMDEDSGEVIINGEVCPEPYIYSQSKLADVEYPLVLGKDEYFILGDNREKSLDSRFSSVGAVSKKEIAGKLILIFRGL